MGTITAHSMNLPQSVQKIIELIISKTKPEKIILFGSRARGDNRENSDFDIACIFKQKNEQAWSHLLVNLHEEVMTLWSVDLVDYSELSEEYKNNIKKEGVTLYE